jgi:DNA-directed RNA polymerase, omega subunit
MLYPSTPNLVEKVGSKYLLVNLVARRARKIFGNGDAESQDQEMKSVAKAIEEVSRGQLTARPITDEDEQIEE